ncbi:DUF305 domain-containing protein [Methylobacterium currus]|uniref:DUF305 domain-containing protein n=1 Tax=Methylobacterium currus TaxID=2051553 RepID=UPI001E4F4448|nr:DUF305 domain-containing protein [Methylobacterium currus]UHC18594.1 DUF305 domain-containing protein [Methylobacterium currus]
MLVRPFADATVWRAALPGLLRSAFSALVSRHHAGAVRMDDQALGQAGDPWVRPLSRTIRHQRRGETGLITGLRVSRRRLAT